MKKDTKLHIRFHNPNSKIETEKYLTKLMATIAVEKYLGSQFKKSYNLTKSESIL